MTITLTREEAQQVLDALISTVRLAGELGVYLMRRDEDEGHAYQTIETLRARLALHDMNKAAEQNGEEL